MSMWATLMTPLTPHLSASMYIAVHSVRLCSIGDPVVARWGRRVTVKDEMTEGDRSVFRPPRDSVLLVGKCMFGIPIDMYRAQ